MLTDAAIKALKPKEKIYKVADRDGMYVRVMPSGAISFRLDYRLNNRRETVYLGKYGRDGISLLQAREKCLDARRAVREGRSPAIEKQRNKRRLKEAKSFGQFGEKWLTSIDLRARASADLEQSAADGNYARRSSRAVCQDRGAWRACHCDPRPRHP